MLTKLYEYLWSWPEKVKEKIRKIGDFLQIGVPFAWFVYVIAIGSWNLLAVSAATFVVSLGLYLLLNAIFNNTRPKETPELTSPPDMDVDWSPTIGNSFPSGHTMGAFAGGIWWFQMNPILGILGVALGVFTGFSRVVAKAHWVRDVLTSMGIATILYVIAILCFL